MKFVNYFLSRKHVQSLKNAATILSVIKTFTDNEVSPCTFITSLIPTITSENLLECVSLTDLSWKNATLCCDQSSFYCTL